MLPRPSPRHPNLPQEDYIDDSSADDSSFAETVESTTSQDEQNGGAQERRAQATHVEKQEEMKQNKRNNRKFKIVKKGCIAAKRLAKQLTRQTERMYTWKRLKLKRVRRGLLILLISLCCTCNAAKDYSTSSSYD